MRCFHSITTKNGLHACWLSASAAASALRSKSAATAASFAACRTQYAITSGLPADPTWQHMQLISEPCTQTALRCWALVGC